MTSGGLTRTPTPCLAAASSRARQLRSCDSEPRCAAFTLYDQGAQGHCCILSKVKRQEHSSVFSLSCVKGSSGRGHRPGTRYLCTHPAHSTLSTRGLQKSTMHAAASRVHAHRGRWCQGCAISPVRLRTRLSTPIAARCLPASRSRTTWPPWTGSPASALLATCTPMLDSVDSAVCTAASCKAWLELDWPGDTHASGVYVIDPEGDGSATRSSARRILTEVAGPLSRRLILWPLSRAILACAPPRQ